MTFNPGPLVGPKGCDLRTGRPVETDQNPPHWTDGPRSNRAAFDKGQRQENMGLRAASVSPASEPTADATVAAHVPPNPNQRPPTIKFTFVANSTRPDDPSGAGRWLVPLRVGGVWVSEVLELQFEDFRDAYRTHTLLESIWKAGKETGQVDFHDHAQQRLLKLLQDFEACRPPPVGTVG